MERDAYDLLDLKSLCCFYAMAKHGSLTRAGIELGISEAAVSQRVRSLEQYLRLKLYEARGGRVRLTPAGERTLALAVSLFDEIRQFQRTLESGGADASELTLCAHDSILRFFLPDKVEAFCRAHPLARLRLLARPVEDTLRMVRSNDCDVAIMPERKLPKELAFQVVARYPACLVLPKGHALTRRARMDFRSVLTAETARSYPLVVLEVQREAGLLESVLQRLDLPLNVVLEVGTIDTLKHYVARGLGIAVISGLCVADEDHARLDVVPVPPDLGAETVYGIVMRRDKRRTPVLKHLISLIAAPGRS